MTKKSNFIASSGNVFADIGCEGAPELLATTQAKVSDIVRGRIKKITLDCLIKMLVAFVRDVDFSYKPSSRGHGMMAVHMM